MTKTANDAYRTALDKAKAEFLATEIERDKLNRKLEKLMQSIAGLAALCDEPAELDRYGLATCLRGVMEENYEFLTPSEWRDKLAENGFPLHEYSNPLALCHATLKRWTQKHEVEPQKVNGKTAYRLIMRFSRLKKDTEDE